MSEWYAADKVADYRARAGRIPHRAEGDAVLLELLPPRVERVLDLGCGDGRLLGTVRAYRSSSVAVALDFSPPMLEQARRRFAGAEGVKVVEHDLAERLPDLGRFDLVVSSLAIHHLEHERKRSLYGEVFDLLDPGGALLNLEHVASPTQALHERFLQEIGEPEDPSNRLLDLETQLGWLRDLGFEDVDVFWKWRELALLAGVKPA